MQSVVKKKLEKLCDSARDFCVSEVMREVSGRCEGGVENRPPSPKPLCTQVFSEIEGGLGLKMKNSCFSGFQASPKEGKGKNDIREFRKQPVYFHEQPVYFHE